jgi:hypothetical protein
MEGGAMESRRIAVGALLAAAVLIFILFSSVFGCLPDDDGSCLSVRGPVRIGLLEGESNVSTARLQVSMRTMKTDLLDFADGTPNLSWLGRSRNTLPEFGKPAQRVTRGLRIPSIRTLPDSDLAHIETVIISREEPANLIQVRRLSAVTQEMARRELAHATALMRQRTAQITARTVPRVSAKPAAPEPVHMPAPVQPGSPDPYNAPAPSATQVYIPAHATVWYSVSDRGRRLTMWIDANHQSGLAMYIYGPDQQDVWNARPVGKAAPGDGHDFFWTGRSAFKGFWRIRLINTNDFAVPYTFTATAVSDKNGDLCRDCHGGSIEDEWERCEHDGSFCEDLKEEFAN